MFQKARFHLVSLLLATVAALTLVGCGTTAAPTEAPRQPTIGILTHAKSLEPAINGLKVGLETLGYAEGTTITYLYDGPASGDGALEPAMQNLLSRKPDLILTVGTPATVLAKKDMEGETIPVIFVPVNDPVQSGIVESLEKPGGYFTGIRGGATDSKALEWLLKITPDAANVLVLHIPEDSSSVQSLNSLSEAAEALDVQLTVVEVHNAEEVKAAAASMPEDVNAVFILRSGTITANAAQLVEAATAQGIPVATSVTDLVTSGALVAYGPDYFEMGKQAARLADQILRGTKSADLPVETGELYLNINLQTANQLGIAVSDEILGQAYTIVRQDNG